MRREPDSPQTTPELTWRDRFRRTVLGPPRDLHDRSMFHRIALAPILAWVGMGADGLSSSAYGPEEAFRTLGEHTYLAVGLAALMVTTVFVISVAYIKIIEQFSEGGGGYVVATHLLGPSAGVISGCALLVDYVLTITVSIAAAADAFFSLLPAEWTVWKLPIETLLIVGLTTLNLRGVRESVMVLTPIFVVFALTHLVAILGGIFGHLPQIPETASRVSSGFQGGLQTLGLGGMLLLFMKAYSLGGGTYTGIEAVSNGVSILREPRVRTARRTMMYMACSLAFTAAGLLLLYLLWHVEHQPGRTMNAVLLDKLTAGVPLGWLFVIITLLSEFAILIVAAQTGFIDGPRVLANMAVDSWVPRRFAALSERLATHNGIALMAGAALAALWYTQGDVRTLVVMYSINVFLTFTLSSFGMLRRSLSSRTPRAARHPLLFGITFALCGTILVVTTMEKFLEGGWVTLVVTGGVCLLCYLIRNRYRYVGAKLTQLLREVENIPRTHQGPPPELDPRQPTAAILVSGYGGLGLHTFMNIHRAFPGYYKNFLFLSVGVVGSGEFKGEDAVERLKVQTQEMQARYVAVAHGLGLPSCGRMRIGTDAIDEAQLLCLEVAKEFPRITFFSGKILFAREQWYQRILHNETAYAIQKHLHWNGHVMVIMPARVR